MTKFFQEVSQDRPLTATRILAAIIVPILAVAFGMLYFFPNHSGELFAWPVKPPMSAMMLGATYVGGVYFFSMVALARPWHSVRLGFLPVTAFAGILGIATALHWDKFTPGHISFTLWAFLYFTLPFVLPVVWYLNNRAAPPIANPAERRFPRPLIYALGALGAVLTVASLLLLLVPQVMIPAWPWALTPLTARVLAAMFALSGTVGLGVAVDGRWSSAQHIFTAQVISIVLILLAIALNRAEIAWTSLGSWAFVLGLLGELALIGWAYIKGR